MKSFFECFLEFIRVFSSFLEFTRVHSSSLEFSRVLSSSLESSRVLSSPLEFSRVLPSSLESSSVLPSAYRTQEIPQVSKILQVFGEKLSLRANICIDIERPVDSGHHLRNSTFHVGHHCCCADVRRVEPWYVCICIGRPSS